jgi:hypothetical protein
MKLERCLTVANTVAIQESVQAAEKDTQINGQINYKITCFQFHTNI